MLYNQETITVLQMGQVSLRPVPDAHEPVTTGPGPPPPGVSLPILVDTEVPTCYTSCYTAHENGPPDLLWRAIWPGSGPNLNLRPLGYEPYDTLVSGVSGRLSRAW